MGARKTIVETTRDKVRDQDPGGRSTERRRRVRKRKEKRGRDKRRINLNGYRKIEK